MLRLTIDGNEIELYENEPVNLSYQFSNLQEINASSSNFSQTFRVPLTKKNQDYFGPVNEFGLIPDWDPKTKVDAELSYNTIPVMRGFVQVKAIYVQKGKYADVELVFFGETANLSRDIGDGMLTDLDLSAYDHTLNATNIEASWTGSLSSGAIRYGLPDKGQNWTSDNLWSSTNPLEHGDFTPYFRASKLLEEILDNAGYEMDSTFFTRQSNLYLLMNRGNRTPIGVGAASPESETFAIGLASNATLFNIDGPEITDFVETSPFYDTNGNVASGVYTAPFRGFYTFRANITYSVASPHSITMGSIIDGTAQVSGDQGYWPLLVQESGSGSITKTSHPILLDQGDTFAIGFEVSDNGHSVTFTGTNQLAPGGTSLELLEITEPLSGQTVDVEANMPEMKQIDFVSGLQKMFNLVFIPDRNNPKKLYIEPFNDYLASGAKKDWTNKIDLSKDLTIEPTTDLQSRRYEWTMSEGKDFVNELVQKNAGRVYGRYRVDDPENDFATGTKEIKSGFAPFVTSYIPNTSFIIHRMLADTTDEDKSIKEPRPRLAYWNGYNNSDNYLFFGNTQTKFPDFSEYENNSLSTQVNGSSLLYGTERPFRELLVSPLNTLYYQYWRPWVNELYSSDARKLTAFFRLTRAELATFEFSDKIYIKDTYWRILSISYDATSEGLAKVELIKVLGNIRDCAWLPYSVDKFGQLTFENASGTTSTTVPTSCCERYGYISTSSNECFQNTPQ